MKKFKIVALTFIIVYAAILRFYKLDKVPPSLNWDEVAAGYNAYTIFHWGADEYGHKFPITFQSFGDDKHPVHIYLTAPIVGLFGLTDYATRASSAAVGVMGVIAIYFLAKKLFKGLPSGANESVGLFASLFLAVSPYHLQFSRGLWETNFALDFFIAGLAMFFYGIEKRDWRLPSAFGLFGISFLSYHSSLVVVPPVVLLVCLLNFRKLITVKKPLIISVLVSLVFIGLVLKDPKILGFARIKQTAFSESLVQSTALYKKTGSTVLGTAEIAFGNYKKYFTYSYLFEKGDGGPRQSVKVIGEFYKIDMVLGMLGILAIFLTKNWQAATIIFSIMALSPIPGALSSYDPSANRGIFLIAPMMLLSAAGATLVVNSVKKKWIQIVFLTTILGVLGYEVGHYLKYYYQSYAKNEAIEWQYGMKQIVSYVARNPEYVKVYMDKIRQQPYIFFLYYLKTSLPDFLKTVKYDESESKSYNTVLSYDKFQFGGWDIIQSYPSYGVLYIVTPSYYTGLKYAGEFNLNDLIKYPNGTDAFYVVSGNREW